jgi:hypothetical protein
MGAYNSWGNGSAMRSAPVGWAFDTVDGVLEQAELTALPTHSHPEGIKGAQAVALAVFLARSGQRKDAIRDELVSRFDYDLSRTLAQIRPGYGFEISCQASVPEAIIAFLESDSVLQAISLAVSLGGDADTQACIAGAIAEAFYGSDSITLAAYVLRTLPDDLLSVTARFSQRHLSAAARGLVRTEQDARSEAVLPARPGVPAVSREQSGTSYRVLLHAATWRRLVGYREELDRDPQIAGGYLSRVMEAARDGCGFAGTEPGSPGELLQALFDTKKPEIFAESAVAADGSDWNLTELGLLGDVSVAVPVTVYDNGLHYRPQVHERPFPAHLIYTPGALLRNDYGETPADWSVVDRDGRIDQAEYTALYERRLLPGLAFASAQAFARGTQSIVTIPGMGCGQFAGRFHGSMGEHLRQALVSILERHASRLPGIRAVWYDPYRECEPSRTEIGSISFFVRPLTKSDPERPQLCHPSAYAELPSDEFESLELWSFVAWDHVSWPGNDFYGGSRSTDDGVKAAATDSMMQLTGFRGRYRSETNAYDPPPGCATWRDVVSRHRLRLDVTEPVVFGAEHVPD